MKDARVYMIGMLCRALAGHDKNKIYIIIEESDEYVYLSDGLLKPKDKAKKKNKKHIQIIKKSVDASLQKRIAEKTEYSNEEIKRAIKLYKKEDYFLLQK